MTIDPKNPLLGERHIDASELDFLLDLPEGGTVVLKRSQPGIKEVVQEIEANQASFGSTIGLSPEGFVELKEIERKLNAIARFRPAVAKLFEMIEETQAKLEDQREKIVGATAREGEELLAKYQKTRTYRSARGKKAAATRRKNSSPKAA